MHERSEIRLLIWRVGHGRGGTHGWGRCLNLEKGVWMRCWSSWAHLSPPATAGMFLFTGVQPAEVSSHYLHRYYVASYPQTHITQIVIAKVGLLQDGG